MEGEPNKETSTEEINTEETAPKTINMRSAEGQQCETNGEHQKQEKIKDEMFKETVEKEGLEEFIKNKSEELYKSDLYRGDKVQYHQEDLIAAFKRGEMDGRGGYNVLRLVLEQKKKTILNRKKDKSPDEIERLRKNKIKLDREEEIVRMSKINKLGAKIKDSIKNPFKKDIK